MKDPKAEHIVETVFDQELSRDHNADRFRVAQMAIGAVNQFGGPVPHDIRHDPTGTGHDRWSCYAKRDGCDGRAVVRQPYMTELEWEHALAAFRELHSNDKTS